MKVYDAPYIRNVALVSHSGSGKTQLASAMLFDADAVNRLGRVDEGTTVTDFDEEEIARRQTLSASPAYAEWKKTKINLIDTPGIANFFSDTCCALRVADAAVVVVDAVYGAEVITEKVWDEAAALDLPCVVVLNRLDRERGGVCNVRSSRCRARSDEPWSPFSFRSASRMNCAESLTWSR
jgi:elongation factor G